MPTKTTTRTRPYDAARYLKTEEQRAAYLEAALESNDTAMIAMALGNLARAKGMTQVARETGLNREALYKSLSPEGNPEFGTVVKIARALGIKLSVAPLPTAASSEPQPPSPSA